MNYPEQLYYTTGHQWISFEAQYALMGITNFAQKELANIVVVAIPRDGKSYLYRFAR